MAENVTIRSVHDLLRLIFRRRRLFLLGSSLFAFALLAAWHYAPLKYSGTAIFEFGLEAAAEQISYTSRESFGAIKARLQHDLAGYEGVKTATEELGLMQGLSHDEQGHLTAEGRARMQEIIGEYMSGVQVNWEARSDREDLIAVNFTHGDPRLAEHMPNVLVAGYINRTYERMRTDLQRQYEFLRGKVEDCDRVLAELTKERIQFETKHAGMLPDNPCALQDKIQQTRAEIQAFRRQYSTANRTLVRMRAFRQESTKGGEAVASQIIKHPNPELARLRGQLRDLRDELDTALTLRHMTDRHPTVEALQAKIAQIEDRIEKTPAEVVKEKIYANDQALIDLSVAIAAAQSQRETSANEVARLQALLDKYEDLWANFAPVRQDYLRFTQQWSERKTEADNWKRRLEQVEVALAAAVNNRLTRLNAVQPAHEQVLPSHPSLLIVLLFAIGGGILFGSGLVFLAKMLDRSITTPEEAARYFNVPVHGVTHEIVTPAQKFLRWLKRWGVRPIVCLVIMAALGLASMSIVLRLRYPGKYKQWDAAPVEFVSREIYEPARGLLKRVLRV